MANMFHFFLVAIVTLHTIYGQEQIPGTNLYTNTRYQIQQNKPGFSRLTYADIYSNTGAKFVQMDDNASRESKYAPDGVWFEDTLWIFYLLNEAEPFVMIKHVLYPDRLLAVDATVEAPQDGVPPANYLILTADPSYTDQGNNLGQFRQYAFWSLFTNGQGGLIMRNLGNRQIVTVSPRSTSDQYYQWVEVTDPSNENYNLRINGV